MERCECRRIDDPQFIHFVEKFDPAANDSPRLELSYNYLEPQSLSLLIAEWRGGVPVNIPHAIDWIEDHSDQYNGLSIVISGFNMSENILKADETLRVAQTIIYMLLRKSAVCKFYFEFGDEFQEMSPAQ